MSDKTYTGNEGIREQTDNLLWVGLIIRQNLRSSPVTVGTSATKIPTIPLSDRRTIIIQNVSSNIVYIGNSSVAVANGFRIYPRGTMQISIEDSVDVYGIAGSSSAIRILEGA